MHTKVKQIEDDIRQNLRRNNTEVLDKKTREIESDSKEASKHLRC